MNWKYLAKSLMMRQCNAGLITGTGRSGTTFLANSLAELHPEIHVEHEIEPTGVGIQNWSSQKQRDTLTNGRGRFAWKGWSQRNQGPVLIESNCFLAPGLEAYMNIWKGCKVVGGIRAWDTCIESMASQTFADSPHFFYAPHDHQRERRPDPVRLGLMSSKEWASFERIEKIAWYWSYINGHLLDMAEKHPENVKLISFEQMKSDTDAVLRDIQTFFDIPVRTLESNVATNSSKERKQRRISLEEFDASAVNKARVLIAETSARVSTYFENS